MTPITHTLKANTPGTQQQLLSLHHGPAHSGRKVLIQAALHADEVPALLVAHHLRQRLASLEAEGRLLGEVVLVPAANPIGLHQRLLHGHPGRFDLASGQNFNRAYADVSATVAQAVAGQLGSDAQANVAAVRQALRAAVAALPVANTLDSLRQTLYGLAVDADIVLDLHCDGEGLLHFYTTPACWPGLELLARCMGAQPVLLADQSGGEPFDEACSGVWRLLAERLGPAHPLPQACLAVTVELRGEADVAHDLAAQDAEAILQFLTLSGHIRGPASEPPALRGPATPLAGSMPIHAPHGGVVVYRCALGSQVRAGELIADLLDPVSGQVSALTAPVDGLLYARDHRRWVSAGMPVARVAGHDALRQGALLTA
jgi:predicted deacylase